MFYEPGKGHGLPHDPFKAIVAPRPIGWISSVGKNGEVNLAPYSFFNALSTNPHLVMFSSEGEKDSVVFSRETGEFVVNLVGRALVEAMNASAVDSPRGVSEFEYAGLTPVASRLVKPPRVEGALAALECKVTEILEPKGLDGQTGDRFVVFGEVVGVHIDRAMLEDGVYQTVRAQPILRGGGPADYFAITEDQLFRMRRPG